MRSSYSSRNMIPINIMVLYNLFTLVLFRLSAWNYHVTNYGEIYLVVIINLMFLYFGYCLAIRAHHSNNLDEALYEHLEDNDSRVIPLLYKWTKIAAVIAIPDMLYYSRMWTLSPAQIFQRLIIGLTESNLNYSLSLGYQNSGTIVERIVVLLTVLLYTFRFAVLPLSILYWGKIDRKQKVLCLFVVTIDIMKWLLKGMNKGIFDYAFVFVASALIVMASNRRQRQFSIKHSELPNKRTKRSRIIIIAGIVIFLAVNIFISNIAARSSRLTTLYYSTSMQLSADPDNVILKMLPTSLHKPVLSLEMYLTCGYQGLSYALRLPFKWCFGIGNNQFMLSNIRDLGLDITNRTYQARVEQAFPWQEFHNWHTTYTWLANDFSFYLLPIVFLVLGYVFALSWLSSVEKHNPYGIIIFCLFIIRLAFLPANNIVLSSSFSFITWVVCIVLWYLSSHGIGIRIGRTVIFNQKY